jgi:hypothetical protein
MDKREEIQRILIEFSEGEIWINKATNDILALFNVVGRSEQLKAFLDYVDGRYSEQGTRDKIVDEFLSL